MKKKKKAQTLTGLEAINFISKNPQANIKVLQGAGEFQTGQQFIPETKRGILGSIAHGIVDPLYKTAVSGSELRGKFQAEKAGEDYAPQYLGQSDYESLQTSPSCRRQRILQGLEASLYRVEVSRAQQQQADCMVLASQSKARSSKEP